MQGHHILRAAMQIACATVIAQAAPQGQDIIQRRGGQGLHIREALQEALEIAQHRADLGLLQHDLRQPHAVRVTHALPWQVVAPLLALPGHEPIRQDRGHLLRMTQQASWRRGAHAPSVLWVASASDARDRSSDRC